MRSYKKFYPALVLLSVFIISCSSDDDSMEEPDELPVTQINSIIYDLGSVSDPDISGNAKIIENSDATITIELDIENTPSGEDHPAHIHFNTAAEGGDIALTLGTVDGDTGLSSITLNTLNDGTPITYDELINFDGYINVHLNSDNLSTLVAQGDIGQNDLTGTMKAYELGSVAVDDIDGTAIFYERENGEALAVINLNNTPEGGEHPGHIHMNTAAEGGSIAFTFNPVNGTTGMSKTNVATLDDGSTFGYNAVLNYDGYINIHLSAEELTTLVAQGDIGQNELTGNVKSYELNEGDISGINGTVEFAERVNQTTLVTITLFGTSAGNSHPAHIHENDIATTGDIIVGLNPVDGATGLSKTQVETLVGGTAITYEEFQSINAYVNVHLSDDDLSTIVAQGNIGDDQGNGDAESKTYEVTNNASSAYVFNGEGFNNTENPNLTLKRGGTYTFNVNTPGHPFLIKTVQGTGTSDLYNDGVTNNGAVSATITFTVPSDAPDTLYYNCEFHAVMTGTINITD